MQVSGEGLRRMQLAPYVEEELVVHGARLADEFAHGWRAPEGVDDGAALECDIRPCRCAVHDERGTCDVDVAERAALVRGAGHNRAENTAVQDGEDDVAPPCELAGSVSADEAQLLVLASGEAGEDILNRGVQSHAGAPGGVEDGLIAAVRAAHGQECEDVRRRGQALHQHLSLCPIHFGSPFRFPACRWRDAQARA